MKQYLILSYGKEGWTICVPGVEEIDGMPTPVWCEDNEARTYYCGTADVEMCIALGDEPNCIVPRHKYFAVEEDRDAWKAKYGSVWEESELRYSELANKYETETKKHKLDIEQLINGINFSTALLCRSLDVEQSKDTLFLDPIITSAERIIGCGGKIDPEVIMFINKMENHVYRFSDRMKVALLNDGIPF